MRTVELARAVLDGSARPEEVQELARLVLDDAADEEAFLREASKELEGLERDVGKLRAENLALRAGLGPHEPIWAALGVEPPRAGGAR